MQENTSFLTQKICEWYGGGLIYKNKVNLEELHLNSKGSKRISVRIESKCKRHLNAAFDPWLVYIICAKSKRLQHHDYGEYKLEYIGKSETFAHNLTTSVNL